MKEDMFKGAPAWATMVEESRKFMGMPLRVWTDGKKYKYIPGYNGYDKSGNTFDFEWDMVGKRVVAERNLEGKAKTLRKKGPKKMAKTVPTLEIRYLDGSKYKVKNPLTMMLTPDYVLILLKQKGEADDDVIEQVSVRIKADSLEKILVKSPNFESSLYFQSGDVVEFIKGTRRNVISGEYNF